MMPNSSDAAAEALVKDVICGARVETEVAAMVMERTTKNSPCILYLSRSETCENLAKRRVQTPVDAEVFGREQDRIYWRFVFPTLCAAFRKSLY